MTERDFELLLQEDISSLPPSDMLADAVNPWKTSMNRILWGLGLVTITLNFLNLNVIFPVIGMAQMLLGFRALRSESRWFRAGYLLAIVRTIWMLIHLFFDATIYSGAYRATNFAVTGTYLMLGLGFFQMLCLRCAIRAVQVKAGLEPHVGSANALLVWYVVIAALAFLNFTGFSVWILLIAYFFILRGLFKLSKELDDAGYAITPAPVKVTDRTLSIGYAAVIAILLAVGYLFFNQYPMDWTVREESAASEIRQELLDLGFPEDVLNDLTEEEILLCQDAGKIHVDTEDYPVNDGHQASKMGSTGNLTIYTAYDTYELRITAIAVEPEDQSEDWVIFHHFQWIMDPGWRSTDAMQFWPTYRENEGWTNAGHLSGRLLYDDGGTTYTAPYYSLGEVTRTSQDWFLGEVTGTDLVAAFSLPRGGENCRGYVCYTTRIVTPGYIINSWCNYYYQETPLWFPVRTAADVINPGVSYHPDAFQMVNTAIQMSYDVDKALEEGIYEYEHFD